MTRRLNYKFNENYDLPLKGKMTEINNEINYNFDKSCINKNYSYKISYEAFYEYCYKMAHFIAKSSGLEDEISNCLHDYFTFYLSNAHYEFPTIRICMSVPGEHDDFVFTFNEKSKRDCYDFENGEYNNNFYDLSSIYIYINNKSIDSDYVEYDKIEGYDTRKLDYFIRCCYKAYNDYSYILLDDFIENSKPSKLSKNVSKYEELLLLYFGGCVSIESESKDKINFKIKNFELDGSKAFNTVFIDNKKSTKFDYIKKFDVKKVDANITYDKSLNYVKINDCSYNKLSLNYSDSGLPYFEYDSIKKRTKKSGTDGDAMNILYDTYVTTIIKNTLYEIFE